MPLAPGSDRATISRNIAEMVHSGYPQRQAVAASLSNARRHPGHQEGGRAQTDADVVDKSRDPFFNKDRAIDRLRPSINRRTGDMAIVANPEEGVIQGDPGEQERPHLAIGGVNLSGLGKTPSIHVPKMAGSAEPKLSMSQMSPWTERSDARMMEHPMSPSGGFGAMHGRMAIGGMSMSQESPWTERSDARIMDQPFHSGLIDSSVPGRTDRLPFSVGNESHIVPADAVSGAGQGNTAAGANIWQAAIHQGPWGVPLPKEIKGHGPPSAPRAGGHTADLFGGAGTTKTTTKGYGDIPGSYAGDYESVAKGGAPDRTSILAAGGELVIPPQYVEDVGRRGQEAGKGKKGESTLATGHRLIDEAIANVRKFQIQWLKKAPLPKKSIGGAV